MFMCSVASELSNYDRALSVGAFLRINTVVILLGDVISLKEVCGSLRYEKFTHFSQNVCLRRVNML